MENPAKAGALNFDPQYIVCSYGVTFQYSYVGWTQTAFSSLTAPATTYNSLKMMGNLIPSRSAYFIDAPVDNYNTGRHLLLLGVVGEDTTRRLRQFLDG